MRKILLFCLSLTFILTGINAGAQTVSPERIKEAEQTVLTARQWLQFVDEKQYVESWEQASTALRKMVPKDAWVKQVSSVRDVMGDVLSRRFSGLRKYNSLPGAPDGEYEVLSFDTSFTNKVSATETVTVTKDVDNVWRVAGYFIR